ncbi:MAG TPA: biotin--[acetyl-CoA-carboxylase] ligase [Elusimicrobia bacterium]|nr:biotin--[acetyl-CoA-carboxylase] ligase [Elusimicrobiota bacterium]
MIHRYKKLPSTQDLARKLAEDGAPPWTIVLAREQTKGRGRMERRWFSGPGGLYFSIVLRPKIAPESLAKLSPAVGEACARALCRATGLETTVKPPNDVLARARGGTFKKVCGILLEASSGSKTVYWLVAGVGVNVSNRLPKSLPEAASLSALAGKRLSASKVLAALLDELRNVLEPARS